MFHELLQKKIHLSWALAYASLSFVLGVICSLYFNMFYSIDWLVVSLCLVSIAIWRINAVKLMVLIFGFFIAGMHRGGVEYAKRGQIEHYRNQVVTIQGFIIDDPSLSNKGDIRFSVDIQQLNGNEFSSELWVSVSQDPVLASYLRRSDQVELSGTVSDGFGPFGAAMYRADILSVNRVQYRDIARDVRDDFAHHVESVIQRPESDLGNGFLLGIQSTLPEKLDQDLRLLGLTHVVVASGYNLTILVRISRRIFSRVSRYTALFGSVGMVISFAYIAGWSPSMVRAALVTLISLGAWYYGRKTHPFVLLSIVAAASVFYKPSYAWGDVGWMLSFLSFVGVIVLAPMIQAYFWENTDSNIGLLRQILVETSSAQLMTAPLIIYIFGQYSPLALLANMLVLPLIPLAMLFTFCAGVFSYISSGTLATIVAWPAQTVLSYMTTIVEWLAILPFAQQELSMGITGLLLSYIVFLMFMVFLYKRTNYQLRNYNIIE